MVKIVFVCYDQGAGGEHLAVEISKLDCCNYLKHDIVNGRYMTRDISGGKARFKPPLPIAEINNLLTQSDKWHVIPTHYLPSAWDLIKATKFFVCITTPSNSKHTSVIPKKIFSRKLTTPLDIKGQIQADGYDPQTILQKHKGPLDYQSLLCLYKGLDITDENIEKVKQEYWAEHFTKVKFKKRISNAINIPYEDTLEPNFYQQFTKKLQDQLTKYS